MIRNKTVKLNREKKQQVTVKFYTVGGYVTQANLDFDATGKPRITYFSDSVNLLDCDH